MNASWDASNDFPKRLKTVWMKTLSVSRRLDLLSIICQEIAEILGVMEFNPVKVINPTQFCGGKEIVPRLEHCQC